MFAAILLLAIAVINQPSKVDPPLAKANELSIANNAATQKALRNSDAVAAMGMRHVIQAQWRERQDNLLSFQEEASNAAGAFNAITKKTLSLAVQSAAIAAGAFLVLRQEISPGMLIAGSILVGRALQPVELAVGAWKGFSRRKINTRTGKAFRNDAAPNRKDGTPTNNRSCERSQCQRDSSGRKTHHLTKCNLRYSSWHRVYGRRAFWRRQKYISQGNARFVADRSGEIRVDGTEPLNLTGLRLDRSLDIYRKISNC